MVNKRALAARLLDCARVFDLLMHARKRSRLPILSVLCYHSVGSPGDDYLFDSDVIDATPDDFRAQLEFLDKYFTVLGIDGLQDIVDGRKAPPNPVAITFDDGYRTCLDVALPMLQDMGFPAVFFIATDFVSNRRLYWWDTINYLVKSSSTDRLDLAYPDTRSFDLQSPSDRRAAIGRLIRVVKDTRGLDLERFLTELAGAAEVEWTRDVERRLAGQLIMTWDDIRTLRDAGMDIQSHTRRHRVLQTLDDERLNDELAGARTDLEREMGEPVHTVAYPVGHSITDEPAILSAVQRAGYRVGFTNKTGVNYLWRSLDRFDISRIAMDRGSSIARFRGELAMPILTYERTHP